MINTELRRKAMEQMLELIGSSPSLAAAFNLRSTDGTSGSGAKPHRVNRVAIAEAERRLAAAENELHSLVRAPLPVQESRMPTAAVERAAAEASLYALLDRAQREAPHIIAERETWRLEEPPEGGI